MENKNFASNGQELSELQLFIGNDGLLSLFHNHQECEVIGGNTNIFGDTLVGKLK